MEVVEKMRLFERDASVDHTVVVCLQQTQASWASLPASVRERLQAQLARMTPDQQLLFYKNQNTVLQKLQQQMLKQQQVLKQQHQQQQQQQQQQQLGSGAGRGQVRTALVNVSCSCNVISMRVPSCNVELCVWGGHTLD